MKLFRRLLSLNPAASWLLALTIGLGALASLVVVAQAVLLSRAIGRTFLGGQSLALLAPLLWALALLALGRAALVWAGEVSAQRFASLVKLDLRARLSDHLLALGPTYAGGERSGELAYTVAEGVEALDEYLARYLPQVALAGLVPPIVLALVVPLDWLSGLVLLLTAPIIPAFTFLIGGASRTLAERQWAGLSRMSAHFLDTLQGLTTLKLFGRSRDQAVAVGQISVQFGRASMQVLRVAFLSALVLELTASLSTAVVAVEVALRLLGGGLAFEQALAVLILAPEFYLPLRLLGSRHHASLAGVEAAKRIFAILDLRVNDQGQEPSTENSEPRTDSGRTVLGCGFSILPVCWDIRFDDVYFAYDGGARQALRGLSFAIGQGEVVALVGPSGAGKSTVAHLLLRFIDADSGSITVDGRPIAALDRDAWRAQVGWAPQRPYLFHGSVADNLRLAHRAASIAELVAAAEAAGAHEFIAGLPQGYDTPIGERGMRLSGGQAQRLALARAFLKDAPILILDEPTAHLDPAHAEIVRASIASAARGRSVLLITHQLSLAAGADRILAVERGRVVREGGYAELIGQDGADRQLVAAGARP